MRGDPMARKIPHRLLFLILLLTLLSAPKEVVGSDKLRILVSAEAPPKGLLPKRCPSTFFEPQENWANSLFKGLTQESDRISKIVLGTEGLLTIETMWFSLTDLRQALNKEKVRPGSNGSITSAGVTHTIDDYVAMLDQIEATDKFLLDSKRKLNGTEIDRWCQFG